MKKEKIIIFRCSKCREVRGCVKIGGIKGESLLHFCLVGSKNQCSFLGTDSCLYSQVLEKRLEIEIIEGVFNCCFNPYSSSNSSFEF